MEKEKESSGGFATYLWIGSGLLLLLIDDKFTLISWQSLVYFTIGSFAAAILLGWFIYGTQRGLGKILLLFISSPSDRAGVIVGFLGLILMILQAISIFLIARYAVTLAT